MSKSEASTQCYEELRSAAERLHTLGVTAADPEAATTAAQLVDASHAIVDQLTQDQDDNLSAQTTMDVLFLVWPNGIPLLDENQTSASWWCSPLGSLCARSLGRDDAETISYSCAATMLGVSRGHVAQMVELGLLDRHPDGGVLRTSVVQRLADQAM